MARKRRKIDEGVKGNWLTTYGDMVTLLLTFFVFLFSFSSIDVQKFQKMIYSFQGAIGVLPGGKSMQEAENVFAGFRGLSAGQSAQETHDILSTLQKLDIFLREEGLKQDISARIDERGVVVSFTEQLLFEPGSAELRPEAKRLLSKVGGALKELPNQLSVGGHTDNVPLKGGPYKDNWGLSSVRAAVVASFLSDVVGIDPRRLRAVGYGPFRPLVPNDTDDHRRLNRRVDVVVLSRYSKD